MPGRGGCARGVQAPVEGAVALVVGQQCGVGRIVALAQGGVRFVAVFDGDEAGDLFPGGFAEGDAGEEGGAADVGELGFGDLVDGPVEDVGHGLAPQGGGGAAADEPDRAEAAGPLGVAGEAFDGLEHPAGVQGDAFEHGAGQVGAGGGEREVEPGAAQGGVVDGGAFAVEPGGEQDAVGAGRGFGGEFGEPVEGFRGARVVGVGQHVLDEPVDGAPGDVLDGGDPVASGDGGGQGGDVVAQAGLLGRHVAGEPGAGADVEVGVVVAHGPGAERGRGGVPGPGDDLHALRQGEVGGGARGERADEGCGGDLFGEFREVESGHADQLRVPGQGVRVAVVGAPAQCRGVARGHRTAAGAQGEVFGDVQQPACGVVGVGAFVAQPQGLADRVLAAAGGHAAGLRQPGAQFPGVVPGSGDGGGAAGDVLGVAGAARVHPDDGGVGGGAVGGGGHGAAPLGGEADRFDPGGGVRVRGEQFLDGGGEGLPPVLRVLFGAAAGQQPGGQFAFGHGQDPPPRVRECGAHAAGAQVDAEHRQRAVPVPAPGGESLIRRAADLREDAVEGGEGLVDHFVGVGHGGVDAGAGQRDDAFGGERHRHVAEHVLARAQLVEELGVGQRQVQDARGVQVHDGAEVVGDVRQVVLADEGFEAGAQPVAGGARLRGGVLPVHFDEGVVAGRAGQGVGREGAAGQGALPRGGESARERGHDFFASADPACAGVAAGDALAEDGQVGGDAVVALGAGHAEPEAGDDLVEDQQGAEFVAEFAHGGVEAEGGGVGAGFGADRFEQDRGGAAGLGVRGEPLAQRVEVAGGALAGGGQGVGGDAGGFEGAGTGDAQAVDDLVAPAVVGAADLDDVVLAGVRAGGADGGHDGFGAGAEHAELVHGGHEVVDELGELGFGGVEHPGDRAAVGEQREDLLADGRVVGAEHGGAAGLQEVDVPVAVGVVQVGAFRAGDGERPGVVEGEVVLHPARDDGLGIARGLLGAGGVLLVPGLVVGELLGGQGAERGVRQLLELGLDRGDVRVLADAVAAHGRLRIPCCSSAVCSIRLLLLRATAGAAASACAAFLPRPPAASVEFAYCCSSPGSSFLVVP